MKHDLEGLLMQLRSVRLTAVEKRTARTALIAKLGLLPRQHVPSPFSYLVFSSHTRFAVAFALIFALVLSGGVGTALAAENALPGDTLYPVKISVNENIRSAIALSDEDKAAWESEAVERRLAESAALASQGRLTQETRVELEARIEKKVEKAREKITKLEARGRTEKALEVQTRIEASLVAYEGLLDEIDAQATSSSVRDEVKGLLRAVGKRADDERESRAEREEKISREAETQNARLDALRATADTLIGKAAVRFGEAPESRARIAAGGRIEDAKDALARGDGERAEKAFKQAALRYQESAREAKTAFTLLEAAAKTRLDISERFDDLRRDDSPSDADDSNEPESEQDNKDDDEREDRADTRGKEIRENRIDLNLF